MMLSTRVVSISVGAKSELPSLIAPNSLRASIILVAKSFRFVPKVLRSLLPVKKETKPSIGSISAVRDVNFCVIAASFSTLLASVSSSAAALRTCNADPKPITNGVSVAPKLAKSLDPIRASTRPPIGSIFGVRAESLFVTSQIF